MDETELNIKTDHAEVFNFNYFFCCFGLGYFWILYDKNNLSWSDILTKTKVIKTIKKLFLSFFNNIKERPISKIAGKRTETIVGISDTTEILPNNF
ncbi:MAG: hypothetical protein Ct9H300mP3_08580 [Gammaproteobacteria bacterium]|nr:MAG: hypothetical protein Ct9H300mP3_08580 [Gammaproteobacteria bacterium]